jgi:predicted P-loop ATPase/GTPase
MVENLSPFGKFFEFKSNFSYVMKGVNGILVVGLRDFSPGKTSAALALIRFLREKNVNVCGFKPKAGNNVWYDFDTVYEVLNQCRLYGMDAKLLKENSQTDLPEEVISPVHRLWGMPPINMEKTIVEVPYFIVDRATLCETRHVQRHYVIVNESFPFEHGIENLVDGLCQKAYGVIHISGLDELNRISGLYDRAIYEANKMIESEHELIVYESYSNNALPWNGIKKCISLVIAVEPGRIYAYDADKYLAGVELREGLRKEVTANDICALLKPLKIIKVPPYRSRELHEKLKEKIDSIIKDYIENF